MSDRRYQSGFGNQFATEAVPGTLPAGRNSPQRVAHGLYAEVLSGSAFTAPRAENRRTWLYRRQPSVVAGAYNALLAPQVVFTFSSVTRRRSSANTWRPAVPIAPIGITSGSTTMSEAGMP